MISIVTPAYNNAPEVKKLLDSISLSEGIGFSFEVIVVDDGSRDFAIKEVVEFYNFARYIRLNNNSGAAVARNTGAREAKYDALFFLDSDVTVFPDTIAKAGKLFLNQEVKAFVGHLDLRPLNAGFFPSYKVIMFNSWLPKEDFSTIFTPAIGGIRKDIFFESGGFDETIKGATVEYVKFSYELSKRYVIRFCPDIVVRVKINSFMKALYTDFYSTMKWVIIFSKYKKFDNHCTSIEGGLGRLSGFLTLVSLPVCFIYKLYLLWVLIFVAYLYLNRPFFRLILKNESILFLLRSLITHTILATSTSLGGLSGLLLVIKENLFKRI